MNSAREHQTVIGKIRAFASPKNVLILISGILIGTLICAPLIGWDLLAGWSTLLGSALGAGFAVSGSFVLWQQQSSKDSREARASYVALFQPLRDGALRTSRAPTAQDNPQMKVTHVLFPAFKKDCDKYLARSRIVAPMMSKIGYPGIAKLFAVEDSISHYFDAFERIWGSEDQSLFEAGQHEVQLRAKALADLLDDAITQFSR